MVYNYKKKRSPIVPMYTMIGSTDGVLEKNVGDPRAAKQQIRKIEDTPAPNSYTLPDMVGKTTQSNKRQAPCYSLTRRPTLYEWLFRCNESCSPGPQYNETNPNIFKNSAPHYSLSNRTLLPRDYRYKPDPGSYSPDYVTITRKASPKYSFGIRHSLPRAPIIVDKPE